MTILYTVGSETPPINLAGLLYIADPSDSGRIHSGMRERWDKNEEVEHEGMGMFGQFAQETKEALERQDYVALHKLNG